MVERNSPFSAAFAGERAGIALSPARRAALWQVACWPATHGAVRGALASALDCEIPAPGRAACAPDGRLLVRVEPLKWWIFGPEGPECAECPVMPDAAEGSWLDLSHDQAGIDISGESAAELLKRLVSIDLRENAFPDLSFATTMAHHMITRILRHDQDGVPGYRVLVMRSFADDLRGILGQHLAHFG